MTKKLIFSLLIIVTGMSLLSCNKKPDEKQVPKKAQKKAEETVRTIENNSSSLTEDKESDDIVPKNILIAIDPGHQGFDVDMSAPEPNAPGSSQTKAKATSGTTGKFSQIPEYQLNLDISLLLKEELEKRGYTILLTRENNETAISNAERASLANDAGADCSIRIHANGSEDPSASGALALIPSSTNPYVGELHGESSRLAESILNSYCETTGFANKGLQPNDSMTGINWSSIPVMILEMGFMSNEQDDMQMADGSFRIQMVNGIANGIDKYYGFDGNQNPLEALKKQAEDALAPHVSSGETWAMQVESLTDNAAVQIGNQSLKSASLIKLYVAACVYQNVGKIDGLTLDDETTLLLHKMISASDNDAANKLVKKLGGGDSKLGLSKVNEFCSNSGFLETHMGRLMLDFSASDDNYTSVSDCAKLLRQVYNREFNGSEQIFNSMLQQERRGKIPAGVPTTISIANKTGELDNVENDVAIITTETNAYIICVMSQDLKNPQAARDKTSELSQISYQYFQ